MPDERDNDTRPLVEYLQERGPTPKSELPRKPEISDKIDGVTDFKFPDSSRAEPIYYIHNVHTMEDVLRAAIEANKGRIEQKFDNYTFGITLSKSKGKPWVDAFHNIKGDLSLDLEIQNQYSTEELIEELREIPNVKELTHDDIRAECSFSKSTVTERFGGIERIRLIAAGVIDEENAELHE